MCLRLFGELIRLFSRQQKATHQLTHSLPPRLCSETQSPGRGWVSELSSNFARAITKKKSFSRKTFSNASSEDFALLSIYSQSSYRYRAGRHQQQKTVVIAISTAFFECENKTLKSKSREPNIDCVSNEKVEWNEKKKIEKISIEFSRKVAKTSLLVSQISDFSARNVIQSCVLSR